MANVIIKNKVQVDRAFKAAPGIIRRAINDGIRESTFFIEGEGQKDTPVDTGRLKSSYVSRFEGAGISYKGITGPTADYAIFVHNGTSRMKGRPFLKDAVEDKSNLRQVERFFTEQLQSALNRVGRMTL